MEKRGMRAAHGMRAVHGMSKGRSMRAAHGMCAAIALFLSVLLSGALPLAAFAAQTAGEQAGAQTDEEVIETWINAAAQLEDPMYNPYSYAISGEGGSCAAQGGNAAEGASSDSENSASAASLAGDATNNATANATTNATTNATSSAALAATTFPEKFDLRDPNSDGDRSDSVVTPVKLQDPWGTCWSFAIIAASETSILSNLGKSAADTGLDLSELQLAGSVFRNGGAPEQFAGSEQAGEGYHNTSTNPNAGLDAGGYQTYGSSVFAAGIGPLMESDVPYQNSASLKYCLLDNGTSILNKCLTDSQIEEYESTGWQVKELYWAGNYYDDTFTMQYSDWSVPEDLWSSSYYEFESGNILPAAYSYADGQTVWGDASYIAAVKSELYDFGRGIATSFCATSGLNRNNWCAYNGTVNTSNHAVTIVGWDDTMSKENFANSTGTPEGDGAWLVKNSWGAQTETFPNNNETNPWGIEEDGKHTGYFWLSYYDRSISRMESFDFDVNTYGDAPEYLIDQYDYLPDKSTITSISDTPVSSANIFTAKTDMALRTLGAATYRPNSTVTYEVYLLDDDAQNPTDTGHSTLAYSLDDTYRYGGYHRVTLPESEWIAMREGQRYAVVTTQKCNDDGKYYQGAATNTAQPSTEEVESYREQRKQFHEQTYYENAYFYALSKYRDAGLSEEEAVQKAVEDAKQTVKNSQATIERLTAADVDAYANRYFEAKVNAGESWTSKTSGLWPDGSDSEEPAGAGADSAELANYGGGDSTGGDSGDSSTQTQWTDWSQVAEALKSRYTMVDNLSIKAFSEIRAWASVEELAALQAAINDAQAKLDAAKISESGTDVLTTDTWLTQEQHDAAAAAIEQARAVLAQAGDYKNELANTTPTSDEVNAATETLSVDVQPGTKQASSGEDADSNNNSNTGNESSGDSAADNAENAAPENTTTHNTETAAYTAAASNANTNANSTTTPAAGDSAALCIVILFATTSLAGCVIVRRFAPAN